MRLRSLLAPVLLWVQACGGEPESSPDLELPPLSPYAAESADPDRFSVTEKPPFWLEAMARAGIAGQDGGASIPFSEGALWTFGDTYLGTASNVTGGLTNSALLVDTSGPAPTVRYYTGADGRAQHVVPLQAPETWEKNRLWPGGGIAIAGTTWLYFEVLDIDAAAVGAPSSAGNANAPDGSFAFERVATGLPFAPHSVVRPGDELILYGVLLEDGYDSRVRVMQVPVDRIGEASAYVIVDDRLVSDVFGQVTVRWNEHLQRYLMFHPGNPFEAAHSIMLRVADDPLGPFSDAIEMARVPDAAEQGWDKLLYVPYPHPELDQDGGRVMSLTFCLVGEPVPHLIEVELLPGALARSQRAD